MTQAALENLAIAAAKIHDLPPPLVMAICQIESNWNPWAYRFEPEFKAHYIDLLPIPSSTFISQASEKTGRATSWGLMQVMGQKARELGCTATFLTTLLDPAVNLNYGCRILKNLHVTYADWNKVISAYNAGSPTSRNSRYVSNVNKVRADYEKRLLSARG